MSEARNIKGLKDEVEEISGNIDLALSNGLIDAYALNILVLVRNILKGLISLVEPVDLLENPPTPNLDKGIGWVDGIDPSPGRVYVVPDQPSMDVGLKLWLCTTNTNKSYFAHALDEDQARVMVDEIYGEGTVVNVFNYDNEFQVMKEL